MQRQTRRLQAEPFCKRGNESVENRSVVTAVDGKSADGTLDDPPRLQRMTSMPFPAVTIQSDHAGRRRNIASVPEAAEVLLMSWPIHDGAKLKLARQKCLDALDGREAITDARAAFIEAAKEADIFLDYPLLTK
jgi:Protein of unknown function (DUF982)